MYPISVQELISWLGETLRETCTARTIEAYLLSCGTTLMIDCVYGVCLELMKVALISNCLGFDNFVEGRILLHWLVVAGTHLAGGRQFLPSSLMWPTVHQQTPQYSTQAVDILQFFYSLLWP